MKLKAFFNRVGVETVRLFTKIIDFFSPRKEPSAADFWRRGLESNAKVFCGLYAPMLRVAQGTSKRPTRALSEWLSRAEHHLGDLDHADDALGAMRAVRDADDPDAAAVFARELLGYAAQAGITHDEKGDVLTLDNRTTPAYTDEEGEPMYLGDRVRVVSPAWYSGDRVLESGTCTCVSPAS